MTTGKIATLVVLSVVALIAAIYGVKALVSVTKSPTKPLPKPETKPLETNPVANSDIGKIAYANSDGVIITGSDFNIYKIAKKDEWVGTVYGVGDSTYSVSGGRFVLKGDVYLK